MSARGSVERGGRATYFGTGDADAIDVESLEHFNRLGKARARTVDLLRKWAGQ